MHTIVRCPVTLIEVLEHLAPCTSTGSTRIQGFLSLSLSLSLSLYIEGAHGRVESNRISMHLVKGIECFQHSFPAHFCYVPIRACNRKLEVTVPFMGRNAELEL
ncbi:hypothetical protein O6H91_Y457200 [Diphasiastrum complanatum]|nr:hypothetical protein O6H91_Y457200 [Diphasiastrum complanatum]